MTGPAQCESSRQRKRIKTHHEGAVGGDDFSAAVRPHPLGVRPSGNALTAGVNSKGHAGYFACMPDEIVQALLEYLEPAELLRTSHTCKYLYAFATFDELWRALFIRSPPSDFEWRGSWRSTLLCFPKSYLPRVDCSHVFSDALHRPYYCSVAPLSAFTERIPRENDISRLPNLTLEEFNDKWTDKPFILTSPVEEWPAYRQWSPDLLLRKYRQTAFRAEAVDWPLGTYFDYMSDSHDESPLYLFDRSFAEKMGVTYQRGTEDAAYWPPGCFEEDLFDVLGEQRPDCRWLIVGPARSGSTFHKDPNGTSAWNAVLSGSKYWIMFPSSPELAPPPGVILSDDQSEITSPLSIAEYLLSFHEIARATPGCREGICHAGEVLHVPSGWFHLVLNLEESIAITQNFVPRKKLVDVMKFLRDCPDQVSGFKDDVDDPFHLFVTGLHKHHPQLLDAANLELSSKGPKHKGKWDQLRGSPSCQDDKPDGFSFGFEDSDVEQ